MKKFLAYLESKKVLAIIFATLYYLAVVFPHEWVGKQVERFLDKPMGRDSYNLFILGIALSIGIVIATLLIRTLKKRSAELRKLLLGLFFLDILLLAVAFNTIIVINIELIHVVQYALMAILLFPIIRNYRDTLFWTSLLGAIDELYQYLVIAAGKSFYYDFNDVVINMLGAALGLILIRSFGVEESKSYNRWIDSPASKMMVFLSTFFLITLAFGWISIHALSNPDESGAFFNFVKEDKPGFWRSLPPNVKFHVMRPIEGFLIIFLLFNIFKNIGYKFAR